MIQTRARLRHREEVAPGHHLLELEAPDIATHAVPGQFVHVRVSEASDPLLRRPISIARADKASGHIWLLSRTIGRGTAIIADMQPGSHLDLIGPLGNGFPLPEAKSEVLLVAGGVGVAPLMFLADALRSAPESHYVHGLFGAASEAALAMWLEFSGRCDEFTCSTDDGSAGEAGLVTEILARELERIGGDVGRGQRTEGPPLVPRQAAGRRGTSPRPTVYTCGPRPMMAAVARLCAAANVPCLASLEQFMGCGIGACLGCVVPTYRADKYQRVCKDGPVFDAQEVAWEELLA